MGDLTERVQFDWGFDWARYLVLLLRAEVTRVIAVTRLAFSGTARNRLAALRTSMSMVLAST